MSPGRRRNGTPMDSSVTPIHSRVSSDTNGYVLGCVPWAQANTGSALQGTASTTGTESTEGTQEVPRDTKGYQGVPRGTDDNIPCGGRGASVPTRRGRMLLRAARTAVRFSDAPAPAPRQRQSRTDLHACTHARTNVCRATVGGPESQGIVMDRGARAVSAYSAQVFVCVGMRARC